MPEPTRDQAYAEHLAATAAERQARYEAGVAEWHARHDEPDTSHLEPAAIAACPVCDDQGYTPSLKICDHHDHASETVNGRAAARAALDEIRNRKAKAKGIPA
jgi:hypothetical protein